AQRVAEAPNRLAAHRSGGDAPFQKGFVRARNCSVVIVGGSGPDAGESPPVDRRNLVKHRTTAVPFAIENTDVVVGETQFFERCFHKQYATVILSGAKLQRSRRSRRCQAFHRRSVSRVITKVQRCLKAWPHASHFVAALRSP